MDGKRVPTLDTLWLWFGRAWGPLACISGGKQFTAKSDMAFLLRSSSRLGILRSDRRTGLLYLVPWEEIAVSDDYNVGVGASCSGRPSIHTNGVTRLENLRHFPSSLAVSCLLGII